MEFETARQKIEDHAALSRREQFLSCSTGPSKSLELLFLVGYKLILKGHFLV